MVAVNILARENRVMINSMKGDIKAIRGDIKDTRIEMTNISNHYSKRLPLPATIMITILASLCTGLIVRALT